MRQHPGSPLPPTQRDFFERSFGCSLDRIRLHADRDAAQALAAEAFAVGRHIVLREAPRDWNAPSTRYLLGHELAHCLQQRMVPDEAPVVGIGFADDRLEREAHRTAARLLAGRRVGPLSPETQAVVRRVPSVVPASAQITVQSKPAAKTPTEVTHDDADGVPAGSMRFDSEEIALKGWATVEGKVGDDLGGITLGWISVEWYETNWAVYQGIRDQDGSMFEPRRVDGLFDQPCRDWDKTRARTVKEVGPGILYDGSDSGQDRYTVPAGVRATKDVPRILLACQFRDSPFEFYRQVRHNLATKDKPNFLHEAAIEMRFCTVLTLRFRDGRYQHLSHIFWNVQWHFSFAPPIKGGELEDAKPWSKSQATPATTLPAVESVRSGGPTQPWAQRVLTAKNVPNCQDVTNSQNTEAFKKVVNLSGFSDFADLKRPLSDAAGPL
jgi:hypothetical protein